MDVDDNFYDEIASFMPPPGGDYNLDDLDEILRSTESHLDASLDMNTFLPTQNVNDFYLKHEQQLQSDDLNFNFRSPATTLQSYASPPYQSQRTSSNSSMDGDNFNVGQFINFFHDDDIKIEEFTSDTLLAMPQRNTPSPTGSCSSSTGSSTSGIQSDASSVASMSQVFAETKFSLENNASVKNLLPSVEATQPNFIVPISPVAFPPPAKTLIAKPPVRLAPPKSTLLPVKATVPLNNVATALPIKVDTQTTTVTTTKLNNVQPLKIITNSGAAGKITPPTNAKPKTIFLSSNDFKALMQKMNNKSKAITKINSNGNGITTPSTKIIMKTSSGKVITANKISPATNDATSQPTFATKIIKTNGPLAIKQPHNTKLMTPRVAVPNSSIYRGLIDEKMYKKQQRMIKNRESASLSRKKKKEYVVSLETRISNLEKENYTLKGENSSLRSQLVAYAQTCHCKNSNISEFILNSLNANTKGNAGSEQPHHVKIAPKPSPKSIKQRLTAASVRRNMAVLFAMAFMVTLNVGSFQTFLNKNTIESSIESIAEEQLTQPAGRHLLWVESENEFNEKLNRSKRETELEVPPLHFLRPTANKNVSGSSAMVEQHQNGTTVKEMPALLAKTTNVIGAKQTENQRLARNLHRWIDGNDYLNLSLHEKFGNELENPTGFKPTPDYFEMKTIDLPRQASVGAMKRKYYMQQSTTPYEKLKERKLKTPLEKAKHSIDLFKPKISDEYIRLFKGIKRQDDTFYVLSFNMDHILLPASAYNKSSRPKMSLMLPAGDPSINGDIVLMQIDCEVVNTTELELKSHMIPEKLRPHKYANGNLNPNDVANNETGPHASKSKHDRMSAKSTTTELKYKPPPVRTFFMMGPKAQAAETVFKKKPTIVKLSGGSANLTLNKNNGTLYAKMRETVEGDILTP